MYHHVVRRTQHRGVKSLVSWILVNIATEHDRHRTAEALELTVTLVVVGCGERVFHPNNLEQFLDEVCYELRPVVRRQRLRGTVLEHPLLGEGFRNVVGSNVAHGEDLSELDEAVRDDEDEDEVPLALRDGPKNVDRNGLEWPGRS